MNAQQLYDGAKWGTAWGSYKTVHIEIEGGDTLCGTLPKRNSEWITRMMSGDIDITCRYCKQAAKEYNKAS